MSGEPPPQHYGWSRFEELCELLAADVRTSDWQVDTIIGLETSGAYAAAQLCVRLGAEHMIVVDVAKEPKAGGGYTRRLGGLAILNPLLIRGKRVLCVDDGIETGALLTELPALVQALGGEPRPAALVGIGNYPALPNLYVAQRLARPPIFPWKRT